MNPKTFGFILTLVSVFVIWVFERYRYRPELLGKDMRWLAHFVHKGVRGFLQTGLWGVSLQAVWYGVGLSFFSGLERTSFLGGGAIGLLMLIFFGPRLLLQETRRRTPYRAVAEILFLMITLSIFCMAAVGFVYPQHARLSLLIYLPLGALSSLGFYLIGAWGWHRLHQYVGYF